jgi:hypothetical protein
MLAIRGNREFPETGELTKWKAEWAEHEEPNSSENGEDSDLSITSPLSPHSPHGRPPSPHQAQAPPTSTSFPSAGGSSGSSSASRDRGSPGAGDQSTSKASTQDRWRKDSDATVMRPAGSGSPSSPYVACFLPRRASKHHCRSQGGQRAPKASPKKIPLFRKEGIDVILGTVQGYVPSVILW